ncbi:hypothetical protein ACIQM4_16395 [Streptomyces sp. NPDC091272]|uniref:hypothetical protein n=1 Tax=Streptomyces sp. NPDC091272 TaxID=3365981 RepID=UPI00380D26E6
MTTEPAAPREAPREPRAVQGAGPAPGPGGTPSLPFDTVAELLTRITAQLSTQLGGTSFNGTRAEGKYPHGAPRGTGTPSPA